MLQPAGYGKTHTMVVGTFGFNACRKPTLRTSRNVPQLRSKLFSHVTCLPTCCWMPELMNEPLSSMQISPKGGETLVVFQANVLGCAGREAMVSPASGSTPAVHHVFTTSPGIESSKGSCCRRFSHDQQSQQANGREPQCPRGGCACGAMVGLPS